MRKILTVGLLMAVGALVLSSMASAEFKSHNGEGKGEGEDIYLKLEAGGGTLTCETFLAGKGKALWLLLKEGKSATSGPDLVLKAEGWQECDASSKELVETTAEVSKCEIELPQSSKELEVTGKLKSTCTIKALTCEVKLEPKENEKLTSFSLKGSGEKDLNLVVEPNVTNVTTKVSGLCPGITATTKGHLLGAVEAKQVQPGDEAEYVVLASKLSLTPGNNTTTITYGKVAGGTNNPEVVRVERGRGSAELVLQEPQTLNCKTKMYSTIGESCSYTMTWNELGRIDQGIAVGGPSGIYSSLWIKAQ